MDREFILGEWNAHPKLQKAIDLWREYYDSCESFDRTVCSGKRHGSVVPLTSREHGEVNRHAGRRHAELRQRIKEESIPDDVSTQAQDIALREHERDLRRAAADD